MGKFISMQKKTTGKSVDAVFNEFISLSIAALKVAKLSKIVKVGIALYVKK